jgi:hypothetical protein
MEQKSSYQIPYHELDVPLNQAPLPPEYSSLHTLYPGVPMLRNDIFDRYYIPHCDPEAACESFHDRRDNTIAAGKHLERLARRSAGGPDDKVTIHAVEDPSVPVEDPALSQLSTQSPIALNDGMEYPTPKADLDHKMDAKHHDSPPDGPTRENFQAINLNEEGGQCHVVYVLIFAGFIVLALLLAGAFVGVKKRRSSS